MTLWARRMLAVAAVGGGVAVSALVGAARVSPGVEGWVRGRLAWMPVPMRAVGAAFADRAGQVGLIPAPLGSSLARLMEVSPGVEEGFLTDAGDVRIVPELRPETTRGGGSFFFTVLEEGDPSWGARPRMPNFELPTERSLRLEAERGVIVPGEVGRLWDLTRPEGSGPQPAPKPGDRAPLDDPLDESVRGPSRDAARVG